MAWRRTGNKPLPVPLLAQFIDTYVALGGDELISVEQMNGLSSS